MDGIKTVVHVLGCVPLLGLVACGSLFFVCDVVALLVDFEVYVTVT